MLNKSLIVHVPPAVLVVMVTRVGYYVEAYHSAIVYSVLCILSFALHLSFYHRNKGLILLLPCFCRTSYHLGGT